MDQLVHDCELHVGEHLRTWQLVVRSVEYREDGARLALVPLDLTSRLGLEFTAVGHYDRDPPVAEAEALLPNGKPLIQKLLGGFSFRRRRVGLPYVRAD